MLDMGKAPEKGMMYAMFTDRIVYQKYSRNNIPSELEEDKLLEMHLFDQDKEYRCIRTRMHGLQEYVITDAFEHDDIYEESVYISGGNADEQENLKEKVTVVNYIIYDENDLLRIVNYRLKEVAE